jgi:hypothetical protein
MEVLHRRVRGQKNTKKLLVQVNKRWLKINPLVQNFNKELRDIGNAVQHIGPLDLEKVKGEGIEYGNLWDIDRIRSQED